MPSVKRPLDGYSQALKRASLWQNPNQGHSCCRISIFIGHYLLGRNHQWLDNKLIEPPAFLPEVGRIRCQKN
jgi:hypothetical protein